MTETSPLTARKKTALEKHLGQSRQYWRDMILGVNDGIISTFLLVTGVAGGGLSSKDILLTSIAGALAGAVSMCAGEYVATKSQNEVITGELALEKLHVESYLEEELSEVKDLIGLIGITDQELAQDMIHYYRSHPDALWHLMKSLEFGVLDSEQRTPITAVCSWIAAFCTPLFVFRGQTRTRITRRSSSHHHRLDGSRGRQKLGHPYALDVCSD